VTLQHVELQQQFVGQRQAGTANRPNASTLQSEALPSVVLPHARETLLGETFHHQRLRNPHKFTNQGKPEQPWQVGGTLSSQVLSHAADFTSNRGTKQSPIGRPPCAVAAQHPAAPRASFPNSFEQNVFLHFDRAV
jgi:hypothetical protein